MDTRIYCHVASCKYSKGTLKLYGSDAIAAEGLCTAETIHLQPCSCDADNIVGCSEFEEEGGE